MKDINYVKEAYNLVNDINQDINDEAFLVCCRKKDELTNQEKEKMGKLIEQDSYFLDQARSGKIKTCLCGGNLFTTGRGDEENVSWSVACEKCDYLIDED